MPLFIINYKRYILVYLTNLLIIFIRKYLELIRMVQLFYKIAKNDHVTTPESRIV